MNTQAKFILGGAGIILAISVVAWVLQYGDAGKDAEQKSDIVSRSGLHWHPHLDVYVQGQKQEIPGGIGLGVIHDPVHTHEKDGIIHLEFQGLVRERDLMLNQFFESWNKDMHAFGSNMRMTVNGQESSEYGNYMMKDGDNIELRYE